MTEDDDTIYGYDKLKGALNKVESYHRDGNYKKALNILWKTDSIIGELKRELNSLIWDEGYRKKCENIIPLVTSVFPGSSIDLFPDEDRIFPGKHLTLFHNLTLFLVVLVLNKRKILYDDHITIEVEVIGMDNDENILPIVLYFHFANDPQDLDEAKNEFHKFQIGKCVSVQVDSDNVSDFTDDPELNCYNFFEPFVRPAEPYEVSPDFLKTVISEIHDQDLYVEEDAVDFDKPLYRINYTKKDIFKFRENKK